MDIETLKQKIYNVLKSGNFRSPDDLVDVSDGTEGYVHLVVVSRKFDGMRVEAADEMIRDDIERGLTDEEQSRITLLVGVSPEEVKAY